VRTSQWKAYKCKRVHHDDDGHPGTYWELWGIIAITITNRT